MKRNTGAAPLAMLFAVVILSCGSEASGDQVVQNPNSVNSITVSNFSMEWSIDGDQLEITASAPTTGWVAVGFGPSSAMKDANIIIGYVQDGEVNVRDDWGDGHISHRADTDLEGISNVTAISGAEENGFTELTFSIPLDSGDPYDKVLEQGETFKVILAFGPDDGDDFQGYHVWAETIELEL